MSELWQRMLAGAESLGTIVPALIGAGIILLTGYFLARQVEKWTDHLLKKMEFNKVAQAGGLTDAMERAGTRLDPVHAIGQAAVLAGDAGGDPALRDRARPREHQPDVRHDALVHSRPSSPRSSS